MSLTLQIDPQHDTYSLPSLARSYLLSEAEVVRTAARLRIVGWRDDGIVKFQRKDVDRLARELLKLAQRKRAQASC
jgi:hypothetical protein